MHKERAGGGKSPSGDTMNCNIMLCPACGTRYPRRAGIILTALCLAACVTSFCVGQFMGSRHGEDQIVEEGKRQFAEFLKIGVDMGFVTVDRGKLDEIECVMAEADWEERDALDRGEGGER